MSWRRSRWAVPAPLCGRLPAGASRSPSPGDDARAPAARRRAAGPDRDRVRARGRARRRRAPPGGRSVAVTERLLVSTVELSISLSNTHAIAAFGFLRGGPEQPASRRATRTRCSSPASRVAGLAREIGPSSGSGPAVRRHHADAADLLRADRRRPRELPPGLPGRQRLPAQGIADDAQHDAAERARPLRDRGAAPHRQLPSGRLGDGAARRRARRRRAAGGARVDAAVPRPRDAAHPQSRAGARDGAAARPRGLDRRRVHGAAQRARRREADRLGSGRAADRHAHPRLARAGRREHRAGGPRRRRGRESGCRTSTAAFRP